MNRKEQIKSVYQQLGGSTGFLQRDDDLLHTAGKSRLPWKAWVVFAAESEAIGYGTV